MQVILKADGIKTARSRKRDKKPVAATSFSVPSFFLLAIFFFTLGINGCGNSNEENIKKCIQGEKQLSLFNVDVPELSSDIDINPDRTKALKDEMWGMFFKKISVTVVEREHNGMLKSIDLTPLIEKNGDKSIGVFLKCKYMSRNEYDGDGHDYAGLECKEGEMAYVVLNEDFKFSDSLNSNWLAIIAIAGKEGYGIICWNGTKIKDNIIKPYDLAYRRFKITSPEGRDFQGEVMEGWFFLEPLLPDRKFEN